MNTYADDIHKHIRCKERKRFKFRGQSAQLQHRPQMIETLDKICREKKFCTPVQHLAAYLLDIFMDNHRVLPGHLEMALIVCIILSVKLEEQDKLPPRFSDFEAYLPKKYKLSEFLQVEIAVLSFFKWNIMFPTVPHFTEYYVLFSLLPKDLLNNKTLNSYMCVEYYVTRYVECFLDIILQDPDYLQFYPSLVAAACIASTRRSLLIKPVWPETLRSVTLYSYEQIEPCVELLLKALDDDLLSKHTNIDDLLKKKISIDNYLGKYKRKLSSSENPAAKVIKS